VYNDFYGSGAATEPGRAGRRSDARKRKGTPEGRCLCRWSDVVGFSSLFRFTRSSPRYEDDFADT